MKLSSNFDRNVNALNKYIQILWEIEKKKKHKP